MAMGKDPVPVGIFSVEMPMVQLVQRLICTKASLNLRRVADGYMKESDFPRLTDVAQRVANAPIHIDDTSAIPIGELRAKALRMKAEHGIAALFVDYLQIVVGSGSNRDSRESFVASVSAGLKAVAKDLDIPVVCLCQLNREAEKRGGTPKLTDLRESGSIEQDADVVLFLTRDETEDDTCDADLTIAKQRNGPVGCVPLTFTKSLTLFTPRVFAGPVPKMGGPKERGRDGLF
jgi:replicative DNA helicase